MIERAYVRQLFKRSRRIEGWFSKQAASMFCIVDAVQAREGVTGDLFEIGVHHGRSSVLMAGLLRDGERLGVCDLFGDQGQNISGSGEGDRAVFEYNIGAYLPPDRLTIFQQYSTSLSPADLGARVRIFHVDGGHDADTALADLRLGAETLAEGGVIVLDDPLRPEWPGVTEAALRFLDERPGMHAFAIGFNKLLFCEDGYVASYRDALLDRDATAGLGLGFPYAVKRAGFGGKELAIFYVPKYRGDHRGTRALGRALERLPRLRRLVKRYVRG